MKADNVESIKAKTNALAQASMKLGEAIYGAQRRRRRRRAGPDRRGGSRRRAARGDNVVDADFEEVKDDKKKSA